MTRRYLVDQSVRAWRERAKPPQLDVEVFDAPGRLDALRQRGRRDAALRPRTGPARARSPQLTGAAKRGGADPPERLAAIVAERAPTTLLCLVAHAKVPDRNPVLAAVKAIARRHLCHPAKKGRELRTWVEAEIAARNGNLAMFFGYGHRLSVLLKEDGRASRIHQSRCEGVACALKGENTRR